MIPRGAQALIDMRNGGQRPAGDVWVTYGTDREPDWWRFAETQYLPEILVRPSDPVERLDLRPVVGLSLIVVLADYTDKAIRLYDRLTEYAQEMAVMSPVFEADVGWWWHKRYGKIDWSERHFLTEYEQSEGDRYHAAHAKKKDHYEAATARSLKLLEDHPWLRF